MSTGIDVKVSVKTDESDKDEAVFSAWKARKDSMSNQAAGGLKPPDGPGGRRKSHFRSMAGLKNLSDLRRMTLTVRTKSDISADNIRPQIQKENTYKMAPDSGTGFSEGKVRKVVYQLLEDECADLTYDQDISSKLACILSERIKDKIKGLGFVRHKIATNLIVAQAGDQGIEIASRCCWNPATDNYACVTYRNKTMLVIALVYGIYFE